DERLLGQAFAVRRIQKHQRERLERMRGPEPRRIAAEDPADTAKPERSDVLAQQRARLGRVVDQQRKGRAARERLKAERTRAGKEIEHARTGDRIAIGVDKDVEQGLAQPVRRRADRVRARRRERAPAQAATDDAHQLLLRRKRRRRFSRRASSGSPRRSASAAWRFGERFFARSLSASSPGGRKAALPGWRLGLRGGPRPLGLAISDRTRLRTMDRDRFLRRSRRGNRPGKVGACERSDPLAELLAQMAGAHLHYFALRQIAELERPE